MRINRLKLTTFRNLAALDVSVPNDAMVIALIGANGVGKTSVLEALSLATPSRGLLGAESRYQIQHGKKQAGVWLQTATHEVGQTFGKGERVLQLDGRKQPLEKLGDAGSVVWLTPETDFLFSGPPATRRRWLDDVTLALIPAHAEATARFRQHRQARLKLLIQDRDDDWLDAEERLAAEWGVKVLRHRLEYLNHLHKHLEGLQLTLKGSALEIMDDAQPEAALKGKFERSREIDRRMERTHAGPNTLDIVGELEVEKGNSVSLLTASSGQHKRALLAWLGAHVNLLAQHRQQPPLVLIDEFSAHLDAQRRQQLLSDLGKLGCQVWISDTEAPAIQSSVYVITLPQS